MANYNAKPPVHSQFKPGQSGNPSGRKKNQDTLKSDLIDALLADFSQHGVAAITKVRDEQPAEYLKVITRVLPKDIDVTTHKGLPAEERKDMVNWLVEQLQQQAKNEKPNGTAH